MTKLGLLWPNAILWSGTSWGLDLHVNWSRINQWNKGDSSRWMKGKLESLLTSS